MLMSMTTLPQPAEECNARITPYAYDTAVIAGSPAPEGILIEGLNPRGDVVGCFVVLAASYDSFMPIYGEDATAGLHPNLAIHRVWVTWVLARVLGFHDKTLSVKNERRPSERRLKCCFFNGKNVH